MAVFGLLSLQVLVPRASQQPGEFGGSLVKAAVEIPLETDVRRQQSGRRVSWLASRHKAAILSDIIINEKLKILKINYLAQKVDVLFSFPSRSHCTCNRTYGKTMYIWETISFSRLFNT